MSQLSRLLDVLASTKGDALSLVEGSAIALHRAGGTHPITKQPLTATQWRALAAEFAPGAALASDGDDADFAAVEQALEHAGGRYLVKLWRAGGLSHALVSVVERPQVAPANGAAAPVVAVAPTEPWCAPVDEAAHARMDALLREQMARGASDLHLRSGETPLLRVNGDIVRITESPIVEPEALGAMLHAIMPDRNRREFHETSDTDFAYELSGVARFRINAFRDRLGPATVCRAIPSRIVTAEELGLSAEVQALCKLTKGLVLVTGPTGSGKSTTLCALVDLVNRMRQDHIVTIEDPIEFVHESKGCLVTQRQVGVHTNSFKQALRATLREDPDVVLVGELRDLETVSIAIETAETGHLVFGTLHTTTASSTIDRIIDQFPPDRQEQVRAMLAESLRGVIAQTLCRKVGGGRVAAMEILLTTPAVSNLIRESKTFQIPSVMQTSRRLGMITLNDALVELVEKGLVAPKEAYLRAVDKGTLAASLKTRGFDLSGIDPEPGSAPNAAPPRPEPVGAGTGGAQNRTPAARTGFGLRR